MLTQEQINQDWTVRSDNYNRYVEEEFATERPAKWLERIVQGRTSGDRDRRIRRNAGACQGKRTQIRSGAGACAGGFW